MGVKMGQKWGFRGFLKNKQADLIPFPREGRYHLCVYVLFLYLVLTLGMLFTALQLLHLQSCLTQTT